MVHRPIREIDLTHIERNEEWDSAGIDIATASIHYGGKATKYEAILHNGELIAFVSEKYVLLPNEVALEVGDELAEEVGAVKMNRSDFGEGDWIGDAMANHVIEYGHQLHAFYVFEDPIAEFDTDAGGRVYLGFSVHNSIDGSLGFGVAGTTFRQACKNMVLFGTPKKFSYHYSERDQGTTIASLYVRHVVKSLVERDLIKDAMSSVLKAAKDIAATYELWSKIRINERLALTLAERIPKKYLPDYISVSRDDEKKLKVELLEAPPMWNAYNSITEALWHSARTGLRTKRDKFKSLEKALPLSPFAYSSDAEAQGVVIE